jgi:hypothetical protein
MRLSGSLGRTATRQARGCGSSPALAAPAARAVGARVPAAATPARQQQRPEQQQRQRQRQRPRHEQQQQRADAPSWVARDAAAPAPSVASSASLDEDAGPSALGPDAARAVAYAAQLAWTAETYEVHPWMLLLALMRDETCAGAAALQRLGLNDLYGAWHEVLWALNVSNGLEPRAFAYKLDWSPGAYRVLTGAARFAGWAGRDAVGTQDILMATAAAGTIGNLFPDVGADFDAVRRAVGEATGDRYRLPGEDAKDAAIKGQGMFL